MTDTQPMPPAFVDAIAAEGFTRIVTAYAPEAPHIVYEVAASETDGGRRVYFRSRMAAEALGDTEVLAGMGKMAAHGLRRALGRLPG